MIETKVLKGMPGVPPGMASKLFRWPDGMITARFLNGTMEQQQIVRDAADEWFKSGIQTDKNRCVFLYTERLCLSIGMKWVDSKADEEASIRIQFGPDNTSSSTVGSDALSVTDQTRPTMRLGEITLPIVATVKHL